MHFKIQSKNFQTDSEYRIKFRIRIKQLRINSYSRKKDVGTKLNYFLVELPKSKINHNYPCKNIFSFTDSALFLKKYPLFSSARI